MDIDSTLASQRSYFIAGTTRSLDFRLAALRRFYDAINAHEAQLLAALRADLGKPETEGYMAEVGIILEDIRHAIGNLRRWQKGQKRAMSIAHFPASIRVRPEPKGIVLIFAPWNYPLQLMLVPLTAAIAAGNCAVLKPSRNSPQCARAIEALVRDAFDPAHVCVAQGGDELNDALLAQPFDHIFFTGSPRVGRMVMEAAAKRLTPVTLELGGKSPCIVDATADIKTAGRRIAWGKALNAGQTCVAPDYLLVHSSVKEALCAAIASAWTTFYSSQPFASRDLGHIVSQGHFDRLCALLQEGDVLAGGQTDPPTLRIAPTLLDNVREGSPLLTDEIFGPILPVLTFDTLDEAIAIVRSHPAPLALYLFTQDKDTVRTITRVLPYGGGCVNDVVIQLADPHFPFGGVGNSGMGHYHGKWGFDTLSHWKTVVRKGKIDLPFRYPPYGNKLGLIKKFLH